MSLPKSFITEGFSPSGQGRARMRLSNGKLLKPIMIGTEGITNSGKSEFILSCPGPGIVISIDRGYEGMLDNPNPPASRRDDFAWKVIPVPLNTTAPQATYIEYFTSIRAEYYKALANKDAVTVAVDTDSSLWELQRLGAFGKLSNVWPQTKYGDVYAQKRAMIARAWDSGKIIIGTNAVRDEYEIVLNPDGTAQKEPDGSEKRRKTGNKQRQGFPDTDYLWSIQIQHLHEPAHTNKVTKKEVPPAWGIRILKCKPRPELLGAELWREDCNFTGLVQLVYPQIDPAEFGL